MGRFIVDGISKSDRISGQPEHRISAQWRSGDDDSYIPLGHAVRENRKGGLQLGPQGSVRINEFICGNF
jgi:hypothetical protein